MVAYRKKLVYTGIRDVGTSRNGFRAHFKDPVHESISFHSSEHEPSSKATHRDSTGHDYPSRFNGNDASSSGVIPHRQNQKPVDSWIDELDFTSPDNLPRGGKDMSEMTIMWFIQQSLPKPFSGTPIDWIEFIVKFKEANS